MSEHRDPLDRRAFLGHAAVLGAAAAGGVKLPAAGPPLGAAPAAPPAPAPFELEEVTAVQLQAGMASGRWTSRRIVEQYLERIAALDRAGPSLHAIIETNPDAVSLAEALDRERAAGRTRGPLHGVPVLLKDNIDTADRMTTTAGSLALEGSVPLRDSHVAERLRAAGAVLLAKANLSEWANIRSSHSSSGWSARGGQCRNPYVLDRNPCGSSSGSAAGVSANLGAVAVGTETDGSIVCPAGANGVVGIKPTVGLVSRAGIVPISHTQDTAGPLCRTVADAAALLTAMAGTDARDRATAAAAGHVAPDYTRFLDPAALRGARIGVPREKFFGYSDVTDRLAAAALDAMRGAGAVIVDPADIPHAGTYDDAELEVLLYELKADLNAYLAALGPAAPVRTLADVIAFNERARAREMPYFGQELFVRAQAKGPLTSPGYRKALRDCRRLSRTLGIDAVMTRHRLDALVAPTGNPAWPTDPVNGDHFTGSSSTPAAVAGYPSVSVPMGDAWGLPVNLSFIGRAWSEPVLIRLAYAFEQITMHRKAPRFLPTLA
ncbi:MAG TPA: amidase [Gemmatimonadales bacterium]|jgi:amidase|nr:amidase [Gemmatimonadales bacterium]